MVSGQQITAEPRCGEAQGKPLELGFSGVPSGGALVLGPSVFKQLGKAAGRRGWDELGWDFHTSAHSEPPQRPHKFFFWTFSMILGKIF